MNEVSEFFKPDENRDWLRTVGGVLIAVGLLLTRSGSAAAPAPSRAGGETVRCSSSC